MAFSLPKPRSLSLGTHLWLLISAIYVSLLVFPAYEAYRIAVGEREHLEQMARVDAANVASLIERELIGEIGALRALALAPELRVGNFGGFHARAIEFVRAHGVNVVLRDTSGQQLVNTRVPWGTLLPKGADIFESDREAIRTLSPQVTNIFFGAITNSPLYMVEVPIHQDGDVSYLLGLSRPLSRISEIISNISLSEGRWITIIDGNGHIIARSFNHQETAGKKVLPQAMRAVAAASPASDIVMVSPEGINNFAAFHRIDTSNWTAAVAVNEDILELPLNYTMNSLALIFAAVMIFTTMIAIAYRHFLRRGAFSLLEMAADLEASGGNAHKASGISDLDAVAHKLAQVGQDLHIHEDTRQKLLAALGKSPVIVRSTQGLIEFWGEGAQLIYGYSAEEAIGRVSHVLLNTEFPEPLDQINDELLASEQWKGVLRHRSKQGHTLIVESSWALWRHAHSGKPEAVVETHTDMTARLAQLTAEQASQSKTAFLSAISHDLRQPFQAIRLFQQVLETQVDGPASSVVERMGLALTSAEEMLAAMSDLSVIEAGKLQPKPSCFCVGEVMREVAEDCAALASAAGLRLRYVPTASVAETDRVLFKRMLRNLVVNAIRYTRRGGVLIGCRHSKGELAVQVVDTGIGIPQDQIASIFDAFYQVGDEPQNGARGLGLGLAIVSKLSHLLRLPVTVASQRDRGSVFCLYLPRDEGGSPRL